VSDRRSRLALFGLLTLAVVVFDQATKAVVDSSFGLSSPSPFAPGAEIVAPTPILGDFLRVAKTYNSGAIFGLFDSGALLFALGSIVVAVGIAWYTITRGWRGPFLLVVALGLLMGSALGNLIDRLRFAYVIDFADMGIGSLRWYSFNVADASLSVALVLLVGLALFGGLLVEGREGAKDPASGAGSAPGESGSSGAPGESG
jgi:signal peptidase II